jgi:hypothetical protein
MKFKVLERYLSGVNYLSKQYVFSVGLLYPGLCFATLRCFPLLGFHGLTTMFFSTVILNPLCFVLLGLIIGRHMAIVHTGLAIATAIWVYVQYPAEPLMSLPKELAFNELHSKLPVMYLAGLIYFVGYRVIKYQFRHREGKQSPQAPLTGHCYQ